MIVSRHQAEPRHLGAVEPPAAPEARSVALQNPEILQSGGMLADGLVGEPGHVREGLYAGLELGAATGYAVERGKERIAVLIPGLVRGNIAVAAANEMDDKSFHGRTLFEDSWDTLISSLIGCR